MRKISKAVLAAGMAAATIASGLSFGAASASAAESETETSAPFTFVSRTAANKYVAIGANIMAKEFTTLDAANEYAIKFVTMPKSDGTFTINVADKLDMCMTWSAANNGNLEHFWARDYTDKVSCITDPTIRMLWKQLPDGRIVNREVKGPFYGNTIVDKMALFPAAWPAGSGYPGSSNRPVMYETTNNFLWDSVPTHIDKAFWGEVKSTDVSDRSSVVTGIAKPGATVLLNDSIEVEADKVSGRWEATVGDLKLGKNTITAVEYLDEAAGKTISIEADLKVEPLDGSVAWATKPHEKAIVSGTAQKGAMVIAKNAAGKEIGGGMATDGSFSFPIDAPNAGGATKIVISQEIDKETAGSKELDVTYGVAVDIATPADDSEHDGGVLKLTGTGEPRGLVQLREKGQRTILDAETMGVAGTWSLDATLDAGEHTLEVVQTGKGNNVTTDTVVINPGQNAVAAPTGSVSFDADVSRNATVSGTGAEGGTITLFEGTKKIGDAKVTDGTWSTTINALGAGKHTIRIEQTDVDGVQTATTEADFGAGVAITTPTAGQVAPGKVRVSGTGQDDAKITVKSGSETTTTTVKNGVYGADIEVPASKNEATITVEQRSKGNLSTTASVKVTADGAQTLAPVAITGPGTYSNGVNAQVTGTATPYASVTVKSQWNALKTVTADKNGDWSFWRGFGPNVSYTLTATQTTIAGQSSTSSAFTLDPEGADQSADVAFDGPTKGWYNATGGTNVSGTSAPNASIEIRSQWGLVKTVTADATGHWSFNRGFGPNVVYQLTAKQTRTDTTTSTSDVFLLKPTPSQTSPVVIYGPLDGHYDVKNTLLRGIASPGATVKVSSQWGELKTVTADSDGEWSFNRGYGPTGDYKITAVQTRTNTTTTTSPVFVISPKQQ